MQLLYTISQTCSRLNIGRTKTYELVAAGELELLKIGRKSLITAASIDALIARLIEAADGDR